MTSQLLDFLVLKRPFDFYECLKIVGNDLSEKEKQELLVHIIDEHYNYSQYGLFKRIFNLIIGDGMNLNFNVVHEAPSFLSLVILKTPYLAVLDYFLKKGACINFVGDALALVSEDAFEYEKMYLRRERYQTCLDYAEEKLQKLISSKTSFNTSRDKFEYFESQENDHGDILLDSASYYELKKQSNFLKDIILTKRMVDYLKYLGAKSYKDMKMLKSKT